MKNINFFYLKIFHCLVVKFSVYLNRHVFVMDAASLDLFGRLFHILDTLDLNDLSPNLVVCTLGTSAFFYCLSSCT